MNLNPKIDQLIRKGVHIPNPQAVEIGDEVDINRIAAEGVAIFSGSRICGKETLICQEAQIGYEGPATVVDCYVGPRVALKGGFFQEAAFLEKTSCGLGAHVRGGTILEEQAGIAHTVGLKQTILFPFVTLGSLINFCDCLMAGGTDRKNHSEVGSSYIHFNFTPNQDKATPSLMGDVPRGVMLNQSPIFLGGQGGLVGPCRLAYGTVVAAGTICRKDQLKEDYLVMEGGGRAARIPFKPGGYRNLKRILRNNFNYIGNLIALRQWYREIRRQFVGVAFPKELSDGLIVTLDKGIAERIRQLRIFKEKIVDQGADRSGTGQTFCSQWPQIRDLLDDHQTFKGSAKNRDVFSEIIAEQILTYGRDYTQVIKRLDKDQSALGSSWLQGIVDQVNDKLLSIIDSEPQAQRASE